MGFLEKASQFLNVVLVRVASALLGDHGFVDLRRRFPAPCLEADYGHFRANGIFWSHYDRPGFGLQPNPKEPCWGRSAGASLQEENSGSRKCYQLFHMHGFQCYRCLAGCQAWNGHLEDRGTDGDPTDHLLPIYLWCVLWVCDSLVGLLDRFVEIPGWKGE